MVTHRGQNLVFKTVKGSSQWRTICNLVSFDIIEDAVADVRILRIRQYTGRGLWVKRVTRLLRGSSGTKKRGLRPGEGLIGYSGK
jgi:hypothetical protein